VRFMLHFIYFMCTLLYESHGIQISDVVPGASR